jgi:hypothetical protein
MMVISKLDFEKPYDKVYWPFLQQALRMKVFFPLGVSGLRRLLVKEVWGLK